eukprot:COSAG06_NODE_1256_length_10087_cov_7.646676_6_plen_59_part_00
MIDLKIKQKLTCRARAAAEVPKAHAAGKEHLFQSASNPSQDRSISGALSEPKTHTSPF